MFAADLVIAVMLRLIKDQKPSMVRVWIAPTTSQVIRPSGRHLSGEFDAHSEVSPHVSEQCTSFWNISQVRDKHRGVHAMTHAYAREVKLSASKQDVPSASDQSFYCRKIFIFSKSKVTA
jgi:hypothetical protein